VGKRNTKTVPANMQNNAAFKDSPFKPISLDVQNFQKKFNETRIFEKIKFFFYTV
jgi:hypothetical protein